MKCDDNVCDTIIFVVDDVFDLIADDNGWDTIPSAVDDVDHVVAVFLFVDIDIDVDITISVDFRCWRRKWCKNDVVFYIDKSWCWDKTNILKFRLVITLTLKFDKHIEALVWSIFLHRSFVEMLTWCVLQ